VSRHEDVWGSEGIASRILDLGTKLKLSPLKSVRTHRYPFCRESGHSSGEEKTLCPCRDLNTCRPTGSQSLE
jgi:hypothetical protein